MATKIRIRVGELEVEYEGPEAYLNSKLPQLVDRLSKLAENMPAGTSNGGSPSGRAAGTLASVLNVDQSQRERFLATAEWLHRKGSERIQTSDVTKALRDNRQKKLTNPAACLNQNVTLGFCEKDGKSFYVTEEGRNHLNP